MTKAWKGKGLLVPVFILGSVYATVVLDFPLFFGPATMISLWVPGIYFNQRTDKFSWTDVYWRPSAPHAFLRVPFQYWGLVGPIAIIVERMFR